ncbi:MAG: archaellin/type IV pilin N-terminal domain-containing protein [Acidilobaceae archaeon]
MKRLSRGLSPLLATLLLLAFTIVGALFVYEYFNKTMDLAAKQGETLIVIAKEHKVSDSLKLVTLELVNAHSANVVIKEMREYLETGEIRKVSVLGGDQRDSLVIPPGVKTSVVISVSANARALIIAYEVEGVSFEKSVALAG